MQLKDVQRPIFIFCSETLPHVGLDLHRWCRGREIFIISFVPNEVSVLEQCSKEIFGFDNSGWRERVEKAREKSKSFTEIDFIRLLKSVNDRHISEVKIVEIFRLIGIFPFDTSKVDENYVDENEELVQNDEGEEEEAVGEDEEQLEVPKVKDRVVLQQLRKMRQMNQQLVDVLRSRNFEFLLENAKTIEQQMDQIENCI
jgi:hypothetical protein